MENRTQHREAENTGKSVATLCLGNGRAGALANIPVVSPDIFAHALVHMTRSGQRLVAFCALPRNGSAGQERDLTSPPGAFQLIAALADDAHQHIHLLSTMVEDSFASLTPRLPQAHLFEREMYEKYGLLPEGHPWLKPVRFSKTGGPGVGIMDFYRVEGDEVHEVAVGPIHAGIIECGHFRFQCLGELVMHLEISLGYHHRGAEQLLVGGPDMRSLPLLETISGDASIAWTWAWCALMEGLSGMAPSPGGQVLRALGLELERLANHTGDLGALAGDVGFLPTQAWCGRLRGDWLNMSALLCGSRFGRGFVRPGGTAFDVDAKLLVLLKERLEATARDVEGALAVLWNSPSVMARFTGIGKVEQKDARDLGLVGLAARACGLERDARRSHPMDGVPASPDPATAPWGDVHARARVRHEEIRSSVAFCRRLLENFLDIGDEAPDSALAASAQPGVISQLAPDSIAVSLVEAWRGEVCHMAVTGADGRIRAVQCVDPSFHNWAGLALALRGQQISDFPLCNKSFNLSYCGHDV